MSGVILIRSNILIYYCELELLQTWFLGPSKTGKDGMFCAGVPRGPLGFPFWWMGPFGRFWALGVAGSPWPVLGLVAPVGPGGRFWAWPRPWEPNGRGNPGTIILDVFDAAA